MPYIKQDRRAQIMNFESPKTSGELNFCITSIINEYMVMNKLSYSVINDIVGALECTKMELYRKLAAPYEDIKCEENGEVYTLVHEINRDNMR